MAKPHLDVTNREIQLKRSWPAGTSAMPTAVLRYGGTAACTAVGQGTGGQARIQILSCTTLLVFSDGENSRPASMRPKARRGSVYIGAV